ncbi:uncharacterized protein LOC142986198 [Anticarsia gemmatalis]|uniref:uncharacterized protein LOC142986198 n=1 Tax=Anticarsia gemmatalis TaxID=129554 RepID=UPI003F76908A
MFDDTIGVVLDTGSQSTKAGFAGEASPRVMLPTATGRFRRRGLIDGIPAVYCGLDAIRRRGISNLVWPVQEGMVKDWEEMEKLWHHVFYRELHVPPESSRVMHAVHPLVSRQDMQKMTEILFESFAINGLYLAKSPALVLFASGRTSGVVWENGYSCSYVAPVFEGFHLKHSTIMSPLTGEVLNKRLLKLLRNIGYSFTTPFECDLMDEIKKDMCYVAEDYDEELESAAQQGEEFKVKYMLPDGQFILLGQERFQLAEVLFQPGLDGYLCKSITDTICDSIDLCDIDYRHLFFKNIVFSGGSTLYPGLVNRVTKKLSQDARSGFRSKIDAMDMRQYAAWAGGSMMASLDNLKGFWMTSSEYEDAGSDRTKYKFF